jgi:hypothetical protein
MKTIYISGAVTGDDNYRSKFERAEKFLESRGFKVVNPVKDEVDGKAWSYYLRKDLRKLLDCDCIYVLSDWATSRGALLEINVALSLEMEIIHEGEIK